MISTDEDSGDKIDLLDAEKVAADWEDGPWKSQEAVQGSYKPYITQ